VRRLAIIGGGTVGRTVAERVAAGSVAGVELVGIYERTADDDLPALLTADVVVEAAGRSAVVDHAEAVLGAGIDFVCCSVGALADGPLRARVLAAATRSGARLIIPSGAVGGLDLMRAAAEAGLDEVLVEQRKPARILLDDPLDEARVVFEGSVAQVVELYPETTNVAAAVALAGLGFERTRARVVADPALEANQVVLTARGSFGSFTLSLENVASANPRTSTIVAHSVVVALRALDQPLRLPG
jgi:aspartate dehydrogenase